MSVLKREDGIRFIVQTYRELLVSRAHSRMKDEVRSMARSHGEYVRFFKKGEQFEIVFSSEPGFLLAESIWHHFNCPMDFIYCERLPSDTVILIIVRGGSVYLDTQISLDAVRDEIAASVTGANRYHIYLHGDIPISDKEEPGKYMLPKVAMASFTQVESSVFEVLPANENLQLQPLDLAFRSQKLGKPSPVPLIAIASAVIIGIGMFWMWKAQQQAPVEVVTEQAKTRPYGEYEDTLLSTASPEQKFVEFAQVIAFSSTLPGWELTSIKYKDNRYTLETSPENEFSSLLVFQNWLKDRNIKFTLKDKSVDFSIPSKVSNRSQLEPLRSVDEVVAVIMDRLKRLFPDGGGLTIEGSPILIGLTKKLILNVSFSGVSPDVLILVGRELHSLPVVLSELSASISNGLLSGSLKLTVLGK